MFNLLRNKAGWLWAGLLFGLGTLYFYLMKPDVAGFLYDDGMYLMAAKALATGQGYRLIDVVGSPWFYKYPPLYPAVLALGWLINPDFPHNIVWFKSLNILFSLIALGLWGYYFRAVRKFSLWLSVGLVALIGTNFRWIEVSIELMSEPLFMLLSTLTLILCHRFSQASEPLRAKHLTILVLLSVSAFYTRTMALPLIMALGLWLFLSQRKKQAIQYAAGCFLLMLPWFAWSATKPDTTYPIGDFLVRSFQETYFQSFRMDLKYEYNLIELVSKGVSELIGNLSVQFLPLLERFFLNKPTLLSESVILGLSFTLTVILGRYGWQQLKARQVSPEGLYVGIYLLLLTTWSYHSVYPRFLIPLLPIGWACLVVCLKQSPFTEPLQKRVLAGLCALLLALNLIQIWPYWQKASPNAMAANTNQDLWRTYQETIDFINTHARPHDRIHTETMEDAYLYALYTNQPITDYFIFTPKSLLDKQCPNNQLNCIMAIRQQRELANLELLRQQQVTYLITQTFQIHKMPRNNWRFSPKSSNLADTIQQYHDTRYQPVFQTTDALMTVYQLAPVKDQ